MNVFRFLFVLFVCAYCSVQALAVEYAEFLSRRVNLNLRDQAVVESCPMNPLDEVANTLELEFHTPGYCESQAQSSCASWRSLNPTTATHFLQSHKLTVWHAGDLIQHSKWTAVQVHRWYSEGSEWAEGVDCKLTKLAAFLHDVGKAGDCWWECVEDNTSGKTCFVSAYSPLKYNGQGDRLHPKFCGDMLLGELPMYTTCPSPDWFKQMDTKTPEEKKSALADWLKTHPSAVSFDKLVSCLGLTVEERGKIAVVAYTHWFFGMLNFEPPALTPAGYLDKLREAIAKVNAALGLALQLDEGLVKMAIAVSGADVAASAYVEGACEGADGYDDVIRMVCTAGCPDPSIPCLYKAVYPYESSFKKYKLDVNGPHLRRLVISELRRQAQGQLPATTAHEHEHVLPLVNILS